MATATNPNAANTVHIPAADRSLAVAQAAGWQDNRLGFAFLIFGLVQAKHDIIAVKAAYGAAAVVYQALPDGGHMSDPLMQVAATALAAGQDDQTIPLVNQALPLATQAQNATLLATLKLTKAAALQAAGNNAEAASLRLDSLPAARYGFGSEPQVQTRAAEIAAIGWMDRGR